MNWKCEFGHMWMAQINNRTSKGHRCPYCSGRKIQFGFNDLTTTHPEISRTMVGKDPKKYSFGSKTKVTWKCEEGHLWEQSISRRVKSDCPKCVNRYHSLEVGLNDLATLFPKIAIEAFGWDPKTVTAGSGLKRKWKCGNDHVWDAVVAKRTSKDPHGCPFCSNQKVLIGFNDLGTTHPLIAKTAYGWDPKLIVSGSDKKRDFICSLGHIYSNVIHREIRGEGCLVCRNRRLIVGVNDLKTTHPEIAAQADGWDPKTVFAGTHLKFRWKCKFGHTWNAGVKQRTVVEKPTGCPTCSNNLVLAGFNDLATRYPDLASQASDWDPTTLVFASTKRVKWKCSEGHEWESTIKNRSQLGRNCPSCAEAGFDPNKDAFLYFLENPGWGMLQIGITNVPDQRLNSHRKLGWEVLELRGPMDGHLTQQWETAILRMLKKKGADLSNEKIAGKFDGFSEAWTKATFPVDSIKELMRLTDEYEENLGKGKKVES